MNASLPDQHGGYCMVCYSELTEENSFALKCQHTFCNECWTEYLKDKLDTDYTGIDARCMESVCNIKVGHSIFERFLDGNK